VRCDVDGDGKAEFEISIANGCKVSAEDVIQ